MATWGEILQEVKKSAEEHDGRPDFDAIRRKYLGRLHELTSHDVILYSTNWMSGVGGPDVSISLEDMQGMMEVCRGLHGPNLDLILHSPGGSPEATASVVRYLRKRFAHIRVFIPIAAMSAATMWALACDEIVMGDHSQLGPIDPQVVLPQGNVPARAIIRQFDRAVEECSSDPSKLPAWLPILQQYGPALIEQCEAAEKLGQKLVEEWLGSYMFAGQNEAEMRAKHVAAFFADYEQHRSHSLGISREAVEELGVNVTRLEDDQELQDAVLSIHHATVITFSGAARKIVENHLGRAFVKIGQQLALQVPLQVPGQGGPSGFTAPS